MCYRARRAVPADAPELVRFLALALAHQATLRCWVVECGHAIVGTMCMVARVGLKKPHWLIESVAVDAAHEGRDLTWLPLAPFRAEARLHKVRSDGECLLRGRLY